VPEPTTVALFAAAAVALLLVPGPAVLYIVAQSVAGGRRAGLVSTLGIHVGSLVHVAAAAVGLSSLVVSSARAFEVVKYAGAAYLVYLGVRRLMERTAPGGLVDGRERRSLGRAFRQGMVVNVLNPKTALFFLAFLPQFVDVSRGSVALQIVVLGLTFVLLGLISDSLYALAAGTAVGWLHGSRRVAAGERYFSGGILVGLGVTTALSGSAKRT
jgi:threonine/homoserine/homoserine lactone efflux protein